MLCCLANRTNTGGHCVPDAPAGIRACVGMRRRGGLSAGLLCTAEARHQVSTPLCTAALLISLAPLAQTHHAEIVWTCRRKLDQQAKSLACRFVSSTDGPSHPKLHRYLRPGNGRGFLAALLALGRPTWAQHFTSKGVTPEERHALRSTLLQASHQLTLTCCSYQQFSTPP